MSAEYEWRPVGLTEALDYAVGRTIDHMERDGGEQTTHFTDGTAVRLTVSTHHGTVQTGSWTEEDFEIGEPVGYPSP